MPDALLLGWVEGLWRCSVDAKKASHTTVWMKDINLLLYVEISKWEIMEQMWYPVTN